MRASTARDDCSGAIATGVGQTTGPVTSAIRRKRPTTVSRPHVAMGTQTDIRAVSSPSGV
jgi:hypothetical protein